MDRYKKLLGNTLLFGLATFGSKVLTFLMLPLLTHLVTPDALSTMYLVVNTCNLLVPIVGVCINEAVIRYGMDKTVRKTDIFTSSMLTIFCGYLLLVVCYPLLGMVTRISDYLWLIYIYILTSAMRSTVTHFVRASGFSKLFALDGIFTTVSTLLYMYLFLGPLNWGVNGYVLATIAADAVSSIGLILLLKLYRFFKPRRFKVHVMKEMLRYSFPLVPTAVFWWVTNLSDQYLVDYFCGDWANGLYVISYKIPTIITLVSTIFIQAWQVSAFSEENRREQVKFYSTVFNAYHTLIFLAASGLILMIKPITMVLVKDIYYDSWIHVPFLILAVSFSCLVTFLGTIYNVAKNNRMATVTTFIGAVTNIGLNLWLIPEFGMNLGANGAAIATFASYFVVFLIRAVDTRRFIPIRMNPLRFGFSLLLLLLQTWVAMSEMRFWVLLEIGILLLLLFCNRTPVMVIIRQFSAKILRRRTA